MATEQKGRYMGTYDHYKLDGNTVEVKASDSRSLKKKSSGTGGSRKSSSTTKKKTRKN